MHWLSRLHRLRLRPLPHPRALWNPPIRLRRQLCTQNHTASPLYAALQSHNGDKLAITDSNSEHTYSSLLANADALRQRLPDGPVAVFLPPDASFVSSLLAIWAAGGTAVPLSPLYPAAALAPLLNTVAPSAIVTASALRYGLPSVRSDVVTIDESEPTSSDEDYAARCSRMGRHAPERAMVFFTSGTTGAPKGVVWTQSMLSYQLSTLSKAWQWSPHDRALNVLPLHHIHGMVNVVLSAIYNGAHLEMHTAFDAHSVWHAFRSALPPTVFMAVPAIYKKLILYYDAASSREQAVLREAARQLRLYVCGSASLSRGDFERWKQISGHEILERYGMTETGMTLSNLYDKRVPAMLGEPLPDVETRVEDGQLFVRGPGVFSEYWGQPDVTAQSFKDGWFMTGDVVDYDEETGYYKLLGRASADIIKTGGYKVSALEIEDVLRECEGVVDCCVVGVKDDVLGQRIVAAVVVDGQNVLPALQKRAEEALPRYKIPREYRIVDDFPRNVLGKVQKQVLKLRLGV